MNCRHPFSSVASVNSAMQRARTALADLPVPTRERFLVNEFEALHYDEFGFLEFIRVPQRATQDPIDKEYLAALDIVEAL